MARTTTWGIGLAALTVVAACGGAPPDLVPDLGAADAARVKHDGVAALDVPLTCGTGSYPCGPYGILTGDILEDLSFMGYIDRDNDKKLDTTSPSSKDYSMTAMKEFHQAGYKKLIWINVSAIWCSVCKKETQELAQLYKAGKIDKRVEIYQIMFEDENYKPMDKAKLGEWIEAFGKPSFAYYAGTPLTFPTVMDPSFKMGKYFDKAATPMNMLVDVKTMKIIYAKTGYSLQSMGAAIQQALTN
jgi:thiol-disulfide isomerase/thioredoxin